MAHYVAVLEAAINRLGEHTPPTRQKVYQKARTALASRLAVVGPPPAAVMERQERLLEEAIAEVEGFYAGSVKYDPLAELADIVAENILEEQRRPGDRRDGPRPAEDVPPPIYTEPLAAAAKLTLFPLAWQMDQSPYFSGAVARDVQEALDASAGPKFETRGNASAIVDHKLGEVFASLPEPRTSGPVKLGWQQAYQLEWTNSGLCSLCNKWALCVDQTACWQRDNSVAEMPVPARALVRRYRSIRAAVWKKLWSHDDRATGQNNTRPDEAQGLSYMLRHHLISEHA